MSNTGSHNAGMHLPRPTSSLHSPSSIWIALELHMRSVKAGLSHVFYGQLVFTIIYSEAQMEVIKIQTSHKKENSPCFTVFFFLHCYNSPIAVPSYSCPLLDNPLPIGLEDYQKKYLRIQACTFLDFGSTNTPETVQPYAQYFNKLNVLQFRCTFTIIIHIFCL